MLSRGGWDVSTEAGVNVLPGTGSDDAVTSLAWTILGNSNPSDPFAANVLAPGTVSIDLRSWKPALPVFALAAMIANYE